MDAFYERLIVRAATIDELLSDDFEPLPGQKGETDLAARRLAAWCRSCASGDWSLFSRRLARDGLAIDEVLTRFATVRRKASATPPAWIDDAIWIVTALESPEPQAPLFQSEPCAFENLFMPVVKPGQRTPSVECRSAGVRKPERTRSFLSEPVTFKATVRTLRPGNLRKVRGDAEEQ